jgi:serine/threonine protein kinase
VSEDLCGQIIDDAFEILDLLGQGGMSVVYRARDIQLDREVAVKLLRSGSPASSKAAARLQREAQAVCSLIHPNIVRLYRFGVSQGQPYTAMELLRGKTLQERIAESGPLSSAEARAILDDICQGMQFAHEHGVIHRDLKPSNIMLAEPGGKVKIVDFGLAKLNIESAAELQKLTQTHQLIGTLMYVSPEQCMGSAVDARADVYSMGCLMYEVLTGQLPFTGDSSFSVVYQHLNEIPTISGEIAEPFRDLISRCLEKNPADRPQSFAEISLALNGGKLAPKLPTHKHLNQRVDKWRANSKLLAMAIPAIVALVFLVVMAATGFSVKSNRGKMLARSTEVYARASQLHNQAVHYNQIGDDRRRRSADAALRLVVDQTLQAQENDHLLEPGHLASLYRYGWQCYEESDPEKSLGFRRKEIEVLLKLGNKEEEMANEIVSVGTTLRRHRQLGQRIIQWLEETEKICQPHTAYLKNSFQFAYASTYANSGRYEEARKCWNKIPPGADFCAVPNSVIRLKEMIRANTN